MLDLEASVPLAAPNMKQSTIAGRPPSICRIIAMSSDKIQSEDDFYRRQIAAPRLDCAISERAWVKRELEFWHRCTIEDYTDAGVVVSLGYMVGIAILTPDLWIEPLGALVKTGPAIVLMLVALMTLDNR